MKFIHMIILCLLLTSLSQAGEQEVLTNNVVIVFDASGSMGERMSGSQQSRMEVAKSALRSVLSKIPNNIQVGLLVFSGDGVEDPWVYPLSKRDDQKLIKSLLSVRPGGGTPLGEFIAIGGKSLIEQRRKQFGYGTYRLLVVTDGEASDEDLLEQNVPRILSKGLVLDVIGVDMKQAHTLATKANSYRSGNDPDSLVKAVSEVFAEVSDNESGGSEDMFEDLKAIPDGGALPAIKALSNEKVEEEGNITESSSIDSTQKKDEISGVFIVCLISGIMVFLILLAIVMDS